MVGQDDSEFDEIICPITLKIIEDPVTAADDHTYERSAIQEWIDRATQGAPQSWSVFEVFLFD
jgi:SUMO ligase MMS21 Smc5/6 complex component